MSNFAVPDFRYDAFSQTFTAFGHGYLANPKEVHTIPASAPYEVYLNEIPRGDSPSTLLINEQGGSNFAEVSFSTVPVAGQFRAIYGEEIIPPVSIVGQGTIQFNASDAGKIIECAYYGLGAINQNQFFNELFSGVFGKGQLIADYLQTDTIKEDTANNGIECENEIYNIDDPYQSVIADAATDTHDLSFIGYGKPANFLLSVNFHDTIDAQLHGSLDAIVALVGEVGTKLTFTEIHNDPGTQGVISLSITGLSTRISLTNNTGSQKTVNFKVKYLRLI